MQKRASITETIEGTKQDYPLVSDMAVYYACQMSKNCGRPSGDEVLIAESLNLKSYFQDEDRRVYLAKHYSDVAGFALINQAGILEGTKWTIGEFFVLARFQNRGIGRDMAFHIWDQNQGKWEVSVRPDNLKALKFWRNIISEYTQDQFQESLESVTFDKELPKRIVLSFKSA